MPKEKQVRRQSTSFRQNVLRSHHFALPPFPRPLGAQQRSDITTFWTFNDDAVLRADCAEWMAKDLLLKSSTHVKSVLDTMRLVVCDILAQVPNPLSLGRPVSKQLNSRGVPLRHTLEAVDLGIVVAICKKRMVTQSG